MKKNNIKNVNEVEILESDFTVNGKTYLFPCDVYIRYKYGSKITCENYLRQVMDQLAKYYEWEKDERYIPAMGFKAIFNIDYIGGYKNNGIINCIPVDISFTIVEIVIESIAKHYNWKMVKLSKNKGE